MTSPTGLRFLLVTIVALLSVGCTASTGTYTFSLNIKNDSAQPVTLWITKAGGPTEDGWRSPEDLAINKLWSAESEQAVVLPAKTSIRRDPFKGTFDTDSRAILRVYAGANKFDELLAISSGPSRVDITLQPGANNILIKPGSALDVERVRE
jgi:hypothetical protein